AVANLTGGNRLLIGLGWSSVVLVAWWRDAAQTVELHAGQALELSVLLLATAFQIDLDAGTCTCPKGRRPLICNRPKVAVARSCLRPRRARRARCERSAHGVSTGGACSSTHTRRCSGKRASFRRVRRSMKRDGDVRWWSTASQGWCNWGFARPATSGGERACSSCASQRR